MQAFYKFNFFYLFDFIILLPLLLEDFITPCSTPQELVEWTEHHNKLMEMITTNRNDPQQLKEHIYEKCVWFLYV